MIRKTLLLFLALLLPIMVFLFLHFFGKNEFEIPVYYKSSLEETPIGCEIKYKFPYHVNSSHVELNRPSVIFFKAGLSDEALRESNFQLSRLNDEFKDGAPKIITIKHAADSIYHLENELALSSATYSKEQKCVFLAGANRVVLIDDQNQIRGLYPEASLKEVDRLILELKILFKQY